MDPHIEHATRSWCPLPAAAWYEHDYPHLHGPDEDTGGVPGHPRDREQEAEADAGERKSEPPSPVRHRRLG